MRLRAWYVNGKCILVVDNIQESSFPINYNWGDFLDEYLSGVFDGIMAFAEKVEIDNED